MPRFAQGVLLSSQGVTWTGHLGFHLGGPQTSLAVHLAHLTVILDRQTVALGRLTVLVSQSPAP